MRKNLLSWQRQTYDLNHRDRANLALHIATVPLFQAGSLALVLGPLAGAPLAALAGLGAMIVAVAAQGRGHRREAEAPVPFADPGDFVSRLLVEQWVTFPRFVLSGDFLRAWRGAA